MKKLLSELVKKLASLLTDLCPPMSVSVKTLGVILDQDMSPSLHINKQTWSPRGHILKSLALKPQVLENCPVLGSRTVLFFELLKVCGAPEKFFGKRFFLEIA